MVTNVNLNTSVEFVIDTVMVLTIAEEVHPTMVGEVMVTDGIITKGTTVEMIERNPERMNINTNPRGKPLLCFVLQENMVK